MLLLSSSTTYHVGPRLGPGTEPEPKVWGGKVWTQKKKKKIATSRIKNFLVNLIFYHLFGSTIQIELLRLDMFVRSRYLASCFVIVSSIAILALHFKAQLTLGFLF